MKIVLAVALGSALGGILRYLISTWVDSKLDHPLPWGTVMVNVIGCLLIGLAAELTNAHGKWAMEAYWRSFLLLGILGGFTTFSSFSHQTLELFHLGEFLHASLNVILSVCLCLFSVYLGHLLGNHLNRII
ncbi:MAG: fluoride efflux transporter CrcB [Verrucomicrobiota bacterium]